MKKSLITVLGLILVLSSCTSLSGIKREKTEDGFIKSDDLVLNTTRYEHPALTPEFDVGKYNIYGNKEFENIQAYILDNDFYLEADYGNKGREYLDLDTIMFFTTRAKIVLKVEDKDAPGIYYTYDDGMGTTFENLKIKLSEENMNLLSRFLIADEVYISFGGERGRTDLFKLNKKLRKSILAVINKWNIIQHGEPMIEEPKPEPKPKKVEEEKPANEEATAEAENAEKTEAEASETSDNPSKEAVAVDEKTETEKKDAPVEKTDKQ